MLAAIERITVSCSGCGAKLGVRADVQKQFVKCPRCEESVPLPQDHAPTAAQTAEALQGDDGRQGVADALRLPRESLLSDWLWAGIGAMGGLGVCLALLINGGPAARGCVAALGFSIAGFLVAAWCLDFLSCCSEEVQNWTCGVVFCVAGPIGTFIGWQQGASGAKLPQWTYPAAALGATVLGGCVGWLVRLVWLGKK